MGEGNTMPEVTNTNVEKTYTDAKTGKFVKGNPGGGRPEGSVSIVEGIKRKLLEIEPANKKTYLELFLSKLFLKAIKDGNEQLMRDMINRVDGMPSQRVDTDITTGGQKIIRWLDGDSNTVPATATPTTNAQLPDEVPGSGSR